MYQPKIRELLSYYTESLSNWKTWLSIDGRQRQKLLIDSLKPHWKIHLTTRFSLCYKDVAKCWIPYHREVCRKVKVKVIKVEVEVEVDLISHQVSLRCSRHTRLQRILVSDRMHHAVWLISRLLVVARYQRGRFTRSTMYNVQYAHTWHVYRLPHVHINGN